MTDTSEKSDFLFVIAPLYSTVLCLANIHDDVSLISIHLYAFFPIDTIVHISLQYLRTFVSILFIGIELLIDDY